MCCTNKPALFSLPHVEHQPSCLVTVFNSAYIRAGGGMECEHVLRCKFCFWDAERECRRGDRVVDDWGNNEGEDKKMNGPEEGKMDGESEWVDEEVRGSNEARQLTLPCECVCMVWHNLARPTSPINIRQRGTTHPTHTLNDSPWLTPSKYLKYKIYTVVYPRAQTLSRGMNLCFHKEEISNIPLYVCLHSLNGFAV